MQLKLLENVTNVHRLYTGLKPFANVYKLAYTLLSVIFAQALDINSDGYISKQELLVASQVIVISFSLIFLQTKLVLCHKDDPNSGPC